MHNRVNIVISVDNLVILCNSFVLIFRKYRIILSAKVELTFILSQFSLRTCLECVNYL